MNGSLGRLRRTTVFKGGRGGEPLNGWFVSQLVGGMENHLLGRKM